jgi:RNA polymerase sigma factor (sigma-70 family)
MWTVLRCGSTGVMGRIRRKAARVGGGWGMWQCESPLCDCAELRRRYLAGDRAAGDALVEKLRPLVRAIVKKVLGPERRQEHDDATQTVFWRMFAKLAMWEDKCPFCKWVQAVAVNKCIEIRRSADLARARDEALADLARRRQQRPIASPEMKECIDQAIAQLPSDEWRRVYHLVIDGMQRKEIAAAMGRSPRTIQNWLEAIRDRLQPCREK